jgi:glycosyltransferase involved in cell wall biosynthesis
VGHEQVTVVMPLHNGAAHCVEAMRSVFAQTRLPAEVIVVDDGSDDRSAELLRGMDAPVPLVIETQTNQGQSAARNAGIRRARGSLVAFIDQDDLWTPDHVERLCCPLERDTSMAWAFGDFDEIDDDGRVVTRSYLDHHDVHVARTSIQDLLAADLMVLPSASVLRKDAAEGVGGFDPELSGYEDDDLYIRMFRAGHRAVCVPVSLTAYRVHATGSSATDSFQRSRVRFLAKMQVLIPDHVRSNRCWVRDVLYPRLSETTLLEYAAMLRAGDDEAARRIATTATEMAQVMGVGGRRRLLLAVLRRPAAFRLVARQLRLVPPRLRPHASPAGRAVMAVLGVRLPG